MCWEGKKQLKKQGGENKTKCVEMNKAEQHASRERSPGFPQLHMHMGGEGE